MMLTAVDEDPGAEMRSEGTTTGLRLLAGAALAAAVAVSLTACAFDEGMTGMGLPALSSDEHVDGEPVSFQGVMHIGPQGCLMIGVTDPAGDIADRWAVWPTGAELLPGTDLEPDNGAVVDGESFTEGDRLTGTGRLVELAALPGGTSPGSCFEGSGRYCDALVGGVLVIDDVRHV